MAAACLYSCGDLTSQLADPIKVPPPPIPPAKPNISYSASYVLLQGSSPSISLTNTGGVITSCSITPDISANTGITFSTTDCTMSGTSTAALSINSYSVTASNVSGTSKASFTLYTNLANTVLWLDPDLGVTTDTTGSVTVSSWADLSNNSNSLSQPTKALQPLYLTNTLNGHAVLRFDGAGTYMENNAFTFTGWVLGFSAFVVASQDGGANSYQGIFSNRSSVSNPQDYWTFGTNPSAAPVNNELMINSSHGGASTDYNSTFVPAGGGFFLYSLTAGVNSFFYKNGSQIAGKGSNIGGDANPYFSIGKWFQTNQIWAGDIAEILVYGSNLSASDRATVENYINAKYLLY